MTNEARRKLLHAGMSLWILVLPFAGRTGALVLASVGVLIGLFLFPRLGWDRALSRGNETRWNDGVRGYPVAVFLAVLLFPLPVAAAAWGVLGIGDAVSNVVGRRLGTPGFCGRADRSAAGSVAFVVGGSLAAWLAAAWTVQTAPVVPGTSFAALLPAVAAGVAGAVAELVTPKGRDDNVPVTLSAALAGWAVSGFVSPFDGG